MATGPAVVPGGGADAGRGSSRRGGSADGGVGAAPQRRRRMGEAPMLPASTRSLDRASPAAHRIGKMPFTHPRVFRRSERLRDKVWRLRGTILAVGAPVRAPVRLSRSLRFAAR